ncbi:MAG: exodeoxyribonuclease VII small subunit [Oscillospiraceae bacterium]
MSYEESVKKVEDIIGQLNGGELPLDKAVEAFKQGMTELESCRKALENAKMTVKDAGETDNE